MSMDVITGVGLLIDGDVVAGGAGTYPVTNPARPAEVVLDAPSTSPAQLDLAVAAARRSQRAWAALEPEDRAALVVAAAEAGVAAVEAGDLARLLTREHGKTYLEAIFDTATMGGMAAAFAPLVAEALAPRDLSGGATRIEWVPHGVVAAILPFNWPVSVMGNKVLPALLAGDTVVVKAPPTCPGTVLLVAAAMAEVLPPGVLNVVNGPDAALGAALVGHPDVDMVSFTGGVGTGQAVMAAAAATTPAGRARARRERRRHPGAGRGRRRRAGRSHRGGGLRHERAGLHGHQAPLRAPGPLGRDGGRAGRPAGDRAGRRRAGRRRDHGPGAHGRARGTGSRRCSPRPPRRAPCSCGRAQMRAEDEGVGGLLRLPGAGGGAAAGQRHRARGAVRPRPAGHPLRRHGRGGRRRRTTPPFGLCASVWSNDDALAADVASRLSAGTVFVNAHGLSAIDMYAPMGGWKQSGFGVELGTEGMQAFARQRVRVVRPGPDEQEEST